MQAIQEILVLVENNKRSIFPAHIVAWDDVEDVTIDGISTIVEE
jgi:hypothetical protein